MPKSNSQKLSKAYIAGFFDGEGSVGIRCSHGLYYPRADIANTDRSILEQIGRQYGGKVYSFAKKKGQKQCYILRIQKNDEVIEFLDDIFPWLRIKSLQASCVFAWDAMRKVKGKSLTLDDVELLVDEISWLNKRGDIEKGREPIDLVLDQYASG